MTILVSCVCNNNAHALQPWYTRSPLVPGAVSSIILLDAYAVYRWHSTHSNLRIASLEIHKRGVEIHNCALLVSYRELLVLLKRVEIHGSSVTHE